MRCIVYSATLFLAGPAPVSQSWRFDVWSALVGAAVALLLAWMAYRFRDAMRLGWETMVAPLVRLHRRLQAGAEGRYRELVAARARSLALLAHVAPLDAVFVEPELSYCPPPPLSASEVGLVLAGPQTLPLRRILGGHPRLVILGASGTGRTALLAYLALVCARTTTDDEVDCVETGTTLGLSQERLPLYVPLPAADWGEGGHEEEQKEEERKTDEVDRLLRVAVAAVGGGSSLVGLLRHHLEAGQAIVLADGWDELLPQQRQQAAAWLAGLDTTLPGNLWLVGAGTRGYAPLTEAGFVPLTLMPWGGRQVDAFARQWLEVCTQAGEESPVVFRELAAELRRAVRVGYSPLELALRAFVYLSDRRSLAKRAALFDRALDLLLWQGEETWLFSVCRAALGQVALNLQQEGRATASREEIVAAIESALPPPEERPARAAIHVFRALTGEQGLLRLVGSNCYAFAHSLWEAYLVARQLTAVDPGTLIERLDDPRWAEVLRFYAELGDMKPLVAEWLRSPDDMFHTRLRTLSSWIRVAPEDATWRDGAMAILARAFLKPRHPASVRQAMAEAMAATGLPGVTYFFKQALRHPNAEVRVAAVQGLGRVAGEAEMPVFEAALEDQDAAVCEAAVRGLAHLGIDAATRRLGLLFVDGDDVLRPVAAEALAGCGEEGGTFLREVVDSEDVMIRRAAVFGLARLGARDVLEKVMREDDQWIVRSAASAALEELEEQESVSGVAPLPEIGQLPWLISWAATQGEGVGVGDAARRVLWRALSDGDVSVRLVAAQVLARVGRPDDVEPLRAALTDSEQAIASVALEALAEISRRYDLRLSE